MNPRELKNHIKGYDKRIKGDIALRDSLNHVLGRYIMIGFNKPSKYPKKPLTHGKLNQQNPETMDDISMEKMAKAITTAYRGKIIDKHGCNTKIKNSNKT